MPIRRTPLTLVLALALSGCFAHRAFYDIAARELEQVQAGLKEVRTVHPDGALAATGLGVVDDPRCGDAPRCYVRSGEWRFWHPNGKLEAVVRYRPDVLVICNAVPQYFAYSVRVDSFHVWHPNGVPLARGRFAEAFVPGDTRCPGNRNRVGRVPRSTVLYDSAGVPIRDPHARAELRARIEQL